MTSETENKIIFTTVLIGVISVIVALFFHQPSSPIGDCGTDVALNNGIRIFFAVAINVIVVSVVAFVSCILGVAIYSTINNATRLFRRIKEARENKDPYKTRKIFKKINCKQVTYNLINAMRSFEISWVFFTVAFLFVGGFFASVNHPKMCFKSAGVATDFYLISTLALVFLSTIVTIIFHNLFDKIEYPLKKFLKLV